MNNTGKIILITAILLIIAISVSSCWWMNKDGNNQGTNPDINLDPNGGNHGTTDLPANNAGGGVAIPGWSSISIPSGETEVTVDLPNPIANDGKYFLSFEMRTAETNEVLFTTGYVAPGQSINKVTLTRPLEAGTYNVIVRVQPCRADGSLTNNADMNTVLIVK
jgi:hypothetical protein